MTRNRRTTLLSTLVVAGAMALAACSGTSSSTNPDPSSSASAPSSVPPSTSPATSATPTTTSIADTQRQVLDAYLGMQHAFQSAQQIPDPNNADLRRYTAGAALKLLTNGLTSLQSDGLRGTGTTRFNPAVTELSPAKNPTRASVRDCMDTSGSHLVKIDGASYADPPGGWRLAIATVERVDGTWKVTGLGIHEVGSCTG